MIFEKAQAIGGDEHGPFGLEENTAAAPPIPETPKEETVGDSQPPVSSMPEDDLIIVQTSHVDVSVQQEKTVESSVEQEKAPTSTNKPENNSRANVLDIDGKIHAAVFNDDKWTLPWKKGFTPMPQKEFEASYFFIDETTTQEKETPATVQQVVDGVDAENRTAEEQKTIDEEDRQKKRDTKIEQERAGETMAAEEKAAKQQTGANQSQKSNPSGVGGALAAFISQFVRNPSPAPAAANGTKNTNSDNTTDTTDTASALVSDLNEGKELKVEIAPENFTEKLAETIRLIKQADTSGSFQIARNHVNPEIEKEFFENFFASQSGKELVDTFNQINLARSPYFNNLELTNDLGQIKALEEIMELTTADFKDLELNDLFEGLGKHNPGMLAKLEEHMAEMAEAWAALFDKLAAKVTSSATTSPSPG